MHSLIQTKMFLGREVINGWTFKKVVLASDSPKRFVKVFTSYGVFKTTILLGLPLGVVQDLSNKAFQAFFKNPSDLFSAVISRFFVLKALLH